MIRCDRLGVLVISYAYQDELVSQTGELLQQPNSTVVLAGAPGSGKTRMAIRSIKHYLEQHPNSRVLILAHGQTLIRNQWAEVMAQPESKLEHFVLTTQVRSLWSNDSPKSSRKAREQKRKELENHRVFLALPQTLSRIFEELPIEIDLIVVDEAHQWYFSPSEKEIIEYFSPKSQLLLTGTPSLFNGKPEFKIIGIPLLDLFRYGVVADPMIEIAEGFEQYDYLSYHRKTMELKGESDVSHVSETLQSVLKSICVRMNLGERDDTYNFVATSLADSWINALSQLKKTMIICRDQRYARSVKKIFDDWQIKSEVSISDYGSGLEELERFKSDSEIKLFIVVRRGTLGFDYPELMNVVDLSFSLNVNGLFQAICRIVRKHPEDSNTQKLFIKVTNKEMAPLTYYVMSFAVALSHPKFYWSYSGDYQNISIGVTPQLLELTKLWDRSKFPDLPQVWTFTDLIKNPEALVNSIACTTFSEVQRRIYASGESGEVIEALEKSKSYASLFQFATDEPEAFEVLKREMKTHLLHRQLNERRLDDLKKKGEIRKKEFSKFKLVQKYKSESEFRNENPLPTNLDEREKNILKAAFYRRTRKSKYDQEDTEILDAIVFDESVVINEDGSSYIRHSIPWLAGDDVIIFATEINYNDYDGASLQIDYRGKKVDLEQLIERKFGVKASSEPERKTAKKTKRKRKARPLAEVETPSDISP